MVKLSQQLQQNEGSQRVTRTQRVKQQQDISRQKKEYQRLRDQAQQLQKTEFSNIKSVEEYQQKYNSLSSDLKQFFSTPEQVQEQQNQEILKNKTKVQDRLNWINDQKRIALEKRRYKEQKARSYYEDNRQNENIRDWLNKENREAEADYEEKLAFLRGYEEGLTKGFNELNAGKNIDYGQIENQASQIGDYYERREEASNDESDRRFNEKLKIKKLEEQGYKPFVIEKSDQKGKVEETYLEYYNPNAKDPFVRVATFKPTSQLNVEQYEKSQFGVVPVGRKLQFAGKEYSFTSNTQLYKDESGKLSTKYGSVGLNENELIKQSQDQAYSDWQKSQKGKLNFDFKVLTEGKELPYGYGGQQSISTEPNNVLISTKDYYAIQDRKSGFDLGDTKIIQGVKKGFKYVDERVHFDLSPSPSMPKLTISFGKKEEPTIPELFFKAGEDKLSDVNKSIKSWAIGSEKIEQSEANLEQKYTGKYQQEFESKYMKDLIYENTDFETASKEFEQSDEAKLIQREYGEEYKQDQINLKNEIPTGKKLLAFGGSGGVLFGKSILGLTKTPTRLALTSTAVATGGSVLKAIPSGVGYGISGGLFVYGTAKAISPTSTYEEASSGFLTALISGATLGYGAYKYLRRPVVTTKTIKPPRMDFKTNAVGKDIKIITKEGKVINKILYQNQKLSQVGTAGRRTIVTSKGRLLLNKYLKLDIKPIYKGVPYADPSGYSKAFTRLTKYGYTPYQAKATLRYVSPKITEQYLTKGVLTVQGNKAVGDFTYTTKRPVIDVDKNLGIKTRGGGTVKDIYRIERKLVNIKGKNLVFEQKGRISLALNKQGGLTNIKDLQFSKGFVVGKSSGLKSGFEVTKDGVITKYTPMKYKDLYSVGFERNVFPRDNVLRVDASRTQLINKIIDLQDKGFIKPANVKKTPFSKTFGFDDTKIINKVTKPSTIKDINKVIDKLERGSFSPTKSITKTQTALLKSTPPTPSVKIDNVLKDVILTKQSSDLALKVGTVAGLGSTTKTKTSLKNQLKLNNQLKNLTKTDLNVALKSGVALKQSPVTATAQVLSPKLRNPSVNINLTTPVIRPPKIPTPKIPKRPPFNFYFPNKASKKKLKGKIKRFNEFAYLPDFTSRSIGLDPEVLTGKQAQARIKKILTGLEVRRGVIIK